MPRGENLADVRTRETQSKGGHARAANIRARREAAEERAIERMAAKLDRAVEVYVEGMEATGSVVARDGDVHETDDHRTRITAADRIADRIMGKPVQRTELTGAGGGPVVLENDVSPDSAAAILAGLGGRVGIGPGHAANGHAAPDEVHSA